MLGRTPAISAVAEKEEEEEEEEAHASITPHSDPLSTANI